MATTKKATTTAKATTSNRASNNSKLINKQTKENKMKTFKAETIETTIIDYIQGHQDYIYIKDNQLSYFKQLNKETNTYENLKTDKTQILVKDSEDQLYIIRILPDYQKEETISFGSFKQQVSKTVSPIHKAAAILKYHLNIPELDKLNDYKVLDYIKKFQLPVIITTALHEESGNIYYTLYNPKQQDKLTLSAELLKAEEQ